MEIDLRRRFLIVLYSFVLADSPQVILVEVHWSSYTVCKLIYPPRPF